MDIDGAVVRKKLFKLKPLRTDGLLFKLHHTTSNGTNAKIRFVHGRFHNFQSILAAVNNQGTVFIVDYSLCKFWGLPKLDSCTFVGFPPHNDKLLLIGLENGDILLCDVDSGNVVHILQGHKFGVTSASFAKQIYCLSASKFEALVWNLETATKIQVLNLESDSSLKYVSFVPFSGKVVACFHDDLIQVWSFEKFETIKQFSPSNWKNYLVKSITFTRNGEFMVVSGHVSTIAVFHLESSKLLKIIDLSNHLITIKHIEFVSQAFDGGCNKILGILSGQGIIYFFDIEYNDIISELRCDLEINKFVSSPEGTHVMCLLCSGELEVFDIKQYITPPEEIRVHKVPKKWKINRKRCLNEVKLVKQEMENMLEIKKLKFILKEHFEYPEMFRMKIWEILLHLPNNIYKYNSVINHITLVAFQDLYEKYPLEDKIFLKGLKRLLNNIVTWCPFFAHVEYLPIFAFPFVKVFHNKPLACFEAVCTVILNWCQHWFEYFPLVPANILAITENLLLEHDPELLHYFTTKQVTSQIYIWSLLETAFSEVLTSSEWLILWDHILTNEVPFLISAVVAYSMTQRSLIMALRNTEDFEVFYKNQNPVDMKRFIKISYCVLKNTSQKFHPRQYLNQFSSIEKENYPLFLDYPRKMISFREEEIGKLNKHLIYLLTNEQNLASVENKSRAEGITVEIKEEEKRRLREVEKLCAKQIKDKQDLVELEAKRLQEMNTRINISINKEDSLMEHILTNSVSTYLGSNGKNEKCRHKEKLHGAKNIDLLNKFIKKLETELKNDKDSSSDTFKNSATNETKERNNPLPKRSEMFRKTQGSSSSTYSECKTHSSENCSCGISCPKSVRFTSSTTGGSSENVQ